MKQRPMVDINGVSRSFFACPGSIYASDSVVNKFIDLRYTINDSGETLSVMVDGVTVAFPYEYVTLLVRQAREIRQQKLGRKNDESV